MSSSSPSSSRQLQRLARLYHIQTSYKNVEGKGCMASAETLLATLQALSAPVASLGDVGWALRAREQEILQNALEPVCVFFMPQPVQIELRLPAKRAHSLQFKLKSESGLEQRGEANFKNLPLLSTLENEGIVYETRVLALSFDLALGYHLLSVETGSETLESLLILTPSKTPPGLLSPNAWGIFTPLYALHSSQSLGAGDLKDLEDLMHWVAQKGGEVVGTLPLMAAFLDKPFEASPYSPASRLFWNEFYLHLPSIPEWKECIKGKDFFESSGFQEQAQKFRQSPQVEYQSLMRLKREILQKLAQCLTPTQEMRWESFQKFVQTRPYLKEYARFRAVTDQLGTCWTGWPASLQEGKIEEGDFKAQDYHYHLYVQWILHEQLQLFSQNAHLKDLKLYLDFPLGVSSDSFDVWKEKSQFALGLRVGAPPDLFFTKGQNWDFPPLHPQAIRSHHYNYLRHALQVQLEHADLLRLDHVMALHRLYVIPQGFEAKDGVYLTYPKDELYGLLCLESHRYQSQIIGEDLGTVPSGVRREMRRHGFYGMWVLQYELSPQAQLSSRLPASKIASLNTHDMPPFKGFWEGLDIQDRSQLGLISSEEVSKQKKERSQLAQKLLRFLRENRFLGEGEDDLEEILRSVLTHLGSSAAPLVLVNLEDLWLETSPQNVPGTSTERPNWKRKLRYRFEDFSQMDSLLRSLQTLDESRRRRKKKKRPSNVMKNEPGG